ncbi:SRPBCC family protein [Nocardioides sp. CFH 31398]|uniref:SRPBCC family protein n=1 Tax=Nocardioides sp. CFH 31398 TaxID=2919579 RepID=UPI001F05A2F4|nr:SRPBCC family protein [Nocardioides sp. CFH 31398]MCH1867701.1 SRPBCC family protein [Nocardioides sp. CFH 31398]
MQLTHEFTVPAGIDETWRVLDDIESVGACFPGAQVTSVEGDTFQGTVKVKLGPIALVYSGTGTFTEKDEATHKMVIAAKGKDKRGNGTAGADVVATLAESGPDATVVNVVTDLQITGKPAQFGRGVMQDVSDKLLGKFVECLEGKFTATPEPAAAPAAAAATEVGADASGADATSAAAAAPAAPAADARAGADTQDRVAAGPRAVPTASTGSSGGSHRADEDEALDLGATVLPVLLKSYGPQLAGGLGVLALIIWLIRRR